jgi:hypothetical protein
MLVAFPTAPAGAHAARVESFAPQGVAKQVIHGIAEGCGPLDRL